MYRVAKQQKVMLTGGKGFFCSRFAQRFKNDFDIVSVGREDFDVCNESAVRRFIGECQPDVVIHGAAMTSTFFCNDNPQLARRINVDGAVNVAKACMDNNARLIFISTEQVFNGNASGGPYAEDVDPNPNTVYGQSKLEAENMIRQMYDKVWIVRFAWMFGMPERGCGISANIMWDTVKALMANQKIYASPNEYRAMTYVEDMLVNVKKLLGIPYGLYHYSASNDLNRYETVKYLLEEMRLKNRINDILIKDDKKYSDCVRDARLASNRIKKYDIHFKNTVDGISECISDYNLKRMNE